MPEYNVTCELDLPAAEMERLADELYGTPEAKAASLAVHGAPGDRCGLTLTLKAASLMGAVTLAFSLAEDDWGLAVYAVTALPTDEFDRRNDLVEVPLMLSVPQAADRLGVSEQRVRQLLSGDAPKLTGTKVGRDWLVDATSVAARLGG